MTILQNSILYLGYARDKEEASDAIFRHMNVKGIIGVLKSDEIIWGGETIQKYWEQYSNTVDMSRASYQKILLPQCGQ